MTPEQPPAQSETWISRVEAGIAEISLGLAEFRVANAESERCVAEAIFNDAKEAKNADAER